MELKCLICGIKINTNNFNSNNKSFIMENTKDNIINCPFCGVDKTFIGDNADMYIVDINELDKDTLKILDHAMKLEVFNGQFYKEASKLAHSTELKETFNDLSNIEFMHAKIHKRLGKFKELPTLHIPNYNRHDSDKLLLEEANKREGHAITYYMKHMSKIKSNTIKQIFRALAEVENQHKIITQENITI